MSLPSTSARSRRIVVDRPLDRTMKEDRIKERPDPGSWGMDELMTLAEAARLFWPKGPLTANSLRIAVRDGVLPATTIAGKLLTTRRAIAEMSVCRAAGTKPAEKPPTPAVDVASAAMSAFDAKVAAARAARRRSR